MLVKNYSVILNIVIFYIKSQAVFHGLLRQQFTRVCQSPEDLLLTTQI